MNKDLLRLDEKKSNIRFFPFFQVLLHHRFLVPTQLISTILSSGLDAVQCGRNTILSIYYAMVFFSRLQLSYRFTGAENQIFLVSLLSVDATPIYCQTVRTTRDCERTGGTICNQPKFWTKNLATLLLNQLCTVSETKRLEFEIRFADASQNLGRIVSTLCLNSGNFPAKYSSLLDDPNPKYKDLLYNRLQVLWLVKRNIFLSRSAEYRSPLVSVIENMYFLKPVSW